MPSTISLYRIGPDKFKMSMKVLQQLLHNFKDTVYLTRACSPIAATNTKDSKICKYDNVLVLSCLSLSSVVLGSSYLYY